MGGYDFARLIRSERLELVSLRLLAGLNAAVFVSIPTAALERKAAMALLKWGGL